MRDDEDVSTASAIPAPRPPADEPIAQPADEPITPPANATPPAGQTIGPALPVPPWANNGVPTGQIARPLAPGYAVPGQRAVAAWPPPTGHEPAGWPSAGYGSAAWPSASHGSVGWPSASYGSVGWPSASYGSAGWPNTGYGPVGWPAPARTLEIDPARQLIRMVVAVVAVLLVAFAALLVVVGQRGQDARRGSGNSIQVLGTPAPTPSASEYRYPVSGDTPFDKAVFALKLHAGALLDGDETGWMAAVDQGNAELTTRYRALFQSMRVLGITRFGYTPGISGPDPKDPAAITFPVRADYCFGADTCAVGYPAGFNQALSMKEIDGRYVITAAVARPDPDYAEPTPWEDGKMTFTPGRHVVIGADASEAAYVKTVLPAAERAAAADEQFATMLLAKQDHYRVYLAGEKQWKAWFGGLESWAVGVAMPISQSGYDVVLRVRELQSPVELQVTLQHELGHVITLTGSETFHVDNQWLSEGVAEYIGWSPKHAQQSYRRASVEWAIARKRPTSMIPAAPGAKASLREGDAYYGLSHFAVDCMAQKYGQATMFRFVRLVLVRGEEWDAAAREAYHQPFTKVDQFCAGWIRAQA